MTVALLIAIVVLLLLIWHEARKAHQQLCQVIAQLDERLQMIENRLPKSEEDDEEDEFSYGYAMDKLGPITEGMCTGSKEFVSDDDKCRICGEQFTDKTLEYARLGDSMCAFAPPHFAKK